MKFNKWGKVVDITLAVASIAVPLITSRRSESKANEEMAKKVQEEVAKALSKKHA